MTLLLENAVKSAVVIGLALAIMPMVRRRTAAMRHAILAAALLGAAVAPFLRTVVPAWSIPVSADVIAPAGDILGSLGVPEAAGTTAAHDAAGARVPRRTSTTLIAIWLSGVAINLAILLAGCLRLARLSSRAQRVSDGGWVTAAGEIAREYGLRKPVLLEVPHRSLLVTWGARQPRVLLPRRAMNWPIERIRLVLAHELAHIRRGDWIVQIAAELVRAFYWFNPLCWIACSRLRRESEQACDDQVINRGIDGAEYATHLVHIARELRPAAMWVPAPSIARTSSFERRVRVMLDRKVNRRPMSRSASLAIIVAMLAIVVSITSVAAQVFGSLAGSIIDPMDAALPDVTLVLTNTQTNAKHEVRSDRTGRYEFVGLVPGDYTLEAKLPGFALFRAHVTVGGQSVQRDLRLGIGTLQETISVRASRSRTDVSSPSTSGKPLARRDPPKCGGGGSGGTPVGGNIRPPVKLYDVKPLYPSSAISAGAEGTVTLKSRIGPDGTVEDVEVVSAPGTDLASSATDAVRQWIFDPTYLNCVAVPVTMNVTVNFSLAQ